MCVESEVAESTPLRILEDGETDFVPGKVKPCVAFERPYYEGEFCSAYGDRINGYTNRIESVGECKVEKGHYMVCTCERECTVSDLPERLKPMTDEECDSTPVAVHVLNVVDRIYVSMISHTSIIYLNNFALFAL
uniref:Thyroglobulin type-1 domain-containing protein n=1 Tax=Angiostrongylus cantonensis TaxID=6313 RepID=A0A158PBS9_ANGCA